jgi:UDP-N-acetyl-D-glucosamine dehydrogenase
VSTMTTVTSRSARSDLFHDLCSKIRTKRARCGVMGLGYVGLPLALTLHHGGFNVTGIDIDTNRVRDIQKGHSYITGTADVDLREAVRRQRFQATTDPGVIHDLDAISICVPTPQRKTKAPDLSYIVTAAESIAKDIRSGQLFILESSAPPGTTEKLVRPILESSGLRAGKDFFLACSPERVDPGNMRFGTKDIPKVIGGVTRRCAKLASLLYESSIAKVITVSSARAAETVKLLENSFRSVNIALANEIALICANSGVDVWEVIDAASSKPFGFMPFYPGPGLTGHGVPIDSVYLDWKSFDGFESRFIDLADKINSGMPRYVVTRAMDLLNDAGKSVRGSHVHVLGVTYKKDTGDSRESPAVELIRLLMAVGAHVTYSDPFIPELNIDGQPLDASPSGQEPFAEADLVIVATDHSSFDYAEVVAKATLVFDTRNATRGLRSENLVRL